jgi:hypothetical protein
MFQQEMVQQDFGSVGDGFASLAGYGRESSLLLVARQEARAVVARAREDANIEAQQGVLAQADEALVMG